MGLSPPMSNLVRAIRPPPLCPPPCLGSYHSTIWERVFLSIQMCVVTLQTLGPIKHLDDMTRTESIACRDPICNRCGRTHNHVPVIEKSLCGTCPSIPASSQHASISSATIEKHRVCDSVRSRLSSLAHEGMEVGFDCDMAMQSATFRGRMRFSVKPNSRLRLSVTLPPGRRGANRPPGCGVP